MKVLITTPRLAKKINGNFTLYDYIREIHFFSRLFIGKSTVGVKFIKIFQKPIKIFL